MGKPQKKRQPNQQVKQQPSAPSPAKEPAKHPAKPLIKKIGESHQQWNNWSTVGMFLLALITSIVTAAFNWSQINDIKQADKARVKQFKILENQVELLTKQRELEIGPRLTVDPFEGRVRLADYLPDKEKDPRKPIVRSDGVKRQPFIPDADLGQLVRVKNNGRGPANYVFVFTFIEVIGTKDKEIPQTVRRRKKDDELAVQMKTIAPNQSVPLDHFHYTHPAEFLGKTHAIAGEFGLFCFDEDGYAHTSLQPFSYEVTFDDDTPPYATMETLAPRLVRRSKMNFIHDKSIAAQVESYFLKLIAEESLNDKVKVER